MNSTVAGLGIAAGYNSHPLQGDRRENNDTDSNYENGSKLSDLNANIHYKDNPLIPTTKPQPILANSTPEYVKSYVENYYNHFIPGYHGSENSSGNSHPNTHPNSISNSYLNRYQNAKNTITIATDAWAYGLIMVEMCTGL